MSQHCFETQTSTGRQVEVMIGYDRPLNCLFLVVTATALDTAPTANHDDRDAYQDGDEDGGDPIVYSNLDDIDLIELDGSTLDLDYFKSKLALLGIALPVTIEHEVREDRRQRVGNRFRRHDSAGQVLPGSEG